MHAVRMVLPCLLVIACCGLAIPAEADGRKFVWTYEAKTMPAGAMELEHYLTLEANRVAGSFQLDWIHQAEFEFGLTDRWDLGIYQVFKQVDSGSISWDKYKLRFRGRLSDPGEWPVDPLVYLEWQQGPDGFAFEEKFVLARRFGDLVMALNLSSEQEGGDWGKEWEFKVEAAFALSYEITKFLALGAEAAYEQKAELEGGAADWSPAGVFVGPTVSFTWRRFFWNVGGRYQVTAKDAAFPRFEIRSLLGVTL
jgi:hypothetical protein